MSFVGRCGGRRQVCSVYRIPYSLSLPLLSASAASLCLVFNIFTWSYSISQANKARRSLIVSVLGVAAPRNPPPLGQVDGARAAGREERERKSIKEVCKGIIKVVNV